MGNLNFSRLFLDKRKGRNFQNVLEANLLTLVVVCSIILFLTAHLLNFSTTYVIFYIIIEFLSIVMSFTIALTLWYTYEYSQGYLQILGSSFLAIGLLKLFHVLSFPGMPQFLTDSSNQKAVWFMVFTRLLGAGALLLSSLVANTNYKIKFTRRFSFGVAILTSGIILLFVSYYSPLMQRIPFITNETLLSGFIVFLLLLAIFFFWQYAKKTGEKFFVFLLCGMITSIFGEVALAFHSSAGENFNLLGHLYKLVSYTFMFHVLFGNTVRQPYQDIEKLLNQTITAIARALDGRDKYTFNHSERVAEYACAICQVMVVDKELKDNVRISGLLHDIGKIAVPDSILNKDGPLTSAEREMIKLHPVKGAEILEPIERLQVLRGISEHHERMDGKGYPLGKDGEEISLEARILAVADTFDAITSNRVYRPPKSKDEAISIMVKAAGTQLDSRVVNAFILADKQGLIEPIMQK
ncbi:HD domain-containing phosphohydrolase [Desulfotruncus alcoholivorax]|uniref:HD domain-containing phosphohydrolase n=1 Tax=Desulfotruncus alcoholivorax TaxID=265477 RepID=UPI0006855655|nr:HD domain-containing phosphohydrolase [Desulfotruncus alcoholivorax]